MGISPLLNSVEVLSASSTTLGPITLGAVLSPNSLLMSDAGGVDGQQYVWRVDDPAHGGDFEIFRGTYTAAGPSISIDTMIVSRINGVVTSGSTATKMPITTSSSVRLVWAADDMITRQQVLSRGWLIGG
jgi:hypothetical protein